MKKQQTGNRFINFLIVIALFILAYAFVSSYGFARGGGEINAFSPHNDIAVDGPNEGAIIAINGDGNQASAEMAREPEKAATWPGFLLIAVAGIAALVVVWFLSSHSTVGVYYD